MPGYDGTGPIGSGPMSGGRRGVCSSKGKRSGLVDDVNGQRGRMARCRGSRTMRSGGFGRFDTSEMRPMPMQAESNLERLEIEVSELRKGIETLQQRLGNLT